MGLGAPGWELRQASALGAMLQGLPTLLAPGTLPEHTAI